MAFETIPMYKTTAISPEGWRVHFTLVVCKPAGTESHNSNSSPRTLILFSVSVVSNPQFISFRNDGNFDTAIVRNSSSIAVFARLPTGSRMAGFPFIWFIIAISVTSRTEIFLLFSVIFVTKVRCRNTKNNVSIPYCQPKQLLLTHYFYLLVQE